jgi:hypothetical protein
MFENVPAQQIRKILVCADEILIGMYGAAAAEQLRLVKFIAF